MTKFGSRSVCGGSTLSKECDGYIGHGASRSCKAEKSVVREDTHKEPNVDGRPSGVVQHGVRWYLHQHVSDEQCRQSDLILLISHSKIVLEALESSCGIIVAGIVSEKSVGMSIRRQRKGLTDRCSSKDR